MKIRTRSDYKICPICGACLDVGEVCDCQQEEAAERPQKRLKDTRTYKRPQTHKQPLKRLIRA